VTTGYDLCVTCHGGAGALTNVVQGTYLGVGGGSLRAGGFSNALMNTSLGASATSGATTGAHKVLGMSGYTSDTVWGMGALNSGAGATVVLQCYTCHDPHGKAGSAKGATYRILRAHPDLTGAGSGADVPDTGVTKKYTVNDATGKYYGQIYPAANDTDTDNGKMTALNAWCATCHQRIHATGTGAGSASSGDAIFNYRHRTDGSNVSTSDANGAPGCLTCHVAHGSKAAMSTNSAAVPKPGTAEGGGVYLDSAMLRIDNRGVCQSCHNK